jgi:hypothetical protein
MPPNTGTAPLTCLAEPNEYGRWVPTALLTVFFPHFFFMGSAAAQAGAFLSKGSDRGLDRGLAADESRRQVCLQPRAPPLGATSTPFPLSFDHLLVCRQSRRPVYRQCARTPSFRGTEGVAHSCVPLAGSSTLQVGVGSSERARVWHQRVWQPDSCGEHPLLPPIERL